MVKRQKESADKTKSDQKQTSTSKNANGFDVGQIEILIGLMKKNDLTEFELENGDFKIQLKRGRKEAAGGPTTFAPPIPQVAPVQNVPAPAAEKATSEPDDAHVKVITSPMVGTFYSSSKPGAPPFVSIGDVIGPTKTVCIIEAMKVFNEIQGEISGKIIAVLAKDGDSVEFGKPLFKVDTRE